MDKIKIHVLRTGEVRVSPYLPFGGDDCSIIKASGLTTPKKDRNMITSDITLDKTLQHHFFDFLR